jgi:quinone-modifying oxidoreductase, subunit QmoC
MVECPKNINITHMMYALKTRAMQERFYPERFALPVLAREFSRMIRGSGRITESRLVLRVFLKTAIWRLMGFGKLGWQLMRTGRMRVKREKVEHRNDIVVLLNAVDGMRKELAR